MNRSEFHRTLLRGAVGSAAVGLVSTPRGAVADEGKNRLRRIESYVATRMADHKVPGVGLAIIHRGAITQKHGFGVLEAGSDRRVGLETLFQAASINKAITAMGALALVQRGKLGLDDDVNRHLVS
jgi:CubicO group peptidase (beta-lactamase class C family)